MPRILPHAAPCRRRNSFLLGARSRKAWQATVNGIPRGASIGSLIWTTRRLERISHDRCTSLFKQLSTRGERLREPTFIRAIKSQGLRAMAESSYEPGPAAGHAADDAWPVVSAKQVLHRHARDHELPRRTVAASTPRDNRCRHRCHEEGR